MANLYSDLNQYTPTERAQVKDIEAIYQSLGNICSTQRYERLFNPDFGLDFEDELFELIDDASSLAILTKVAERVDRYEQRITLDFARTQVTPDPDNNRFEILIIFSVKGLETEGAFEYRGIVSR